MAVSDGEMRTQETPDPGLAINSTPDHLGVERMEGDGDQQTIPPPIDDDHNATELQKEVPRCQYSIGGIYHFHWPGAIRKWRPIRVKSTGPWGENIFKIERKYQDTRI